MEKPYEIINIVQGSEEWQAWRRAHICATDASVIMGVSPWSTEEELLKEKVYGSKKKKVSSSMLRGTRLEPSIRSFFEQSKGELYPPACVVSIERRWQGASLDGLSDKGVVLEIKCPSYEDHEKALWGYVPEKYYPQVQHQLSITGSYGYYSSSYKGQRVDVMMEPDLEYIKLLLEKELLFKEKLLHLRCKAV